MKLAREMRSCERCGLYKSRTNVVVGEGPPDAKILFLGEAPGFNEDCLGRPFVGAAGKTLDGLLRDAGLERREVYITNVVKCRPPQNRDPTDEEIEACSLFLHEQLRTIKPKFVVTLGRIAARVLLNRYVSMDRDHGKLLDCTYASTSFKLFMTYHPGAAIYGAETKSRLRGDFAKLGRILKTSGFDR